MYTMKSRANEPTFLKNERKCAATVCGSHLHVPTNPILVPYVIQLNRQIGRFSVTNNLTKKKVLISIGRSEIPKR